MQCEKFDRRFNELLDLRQDPADDAPLVTHASGCTACEQVLEDWRRIGRALAPVSASVSLPGPKSLGPKSASTNSPGSGGELARSGAGSLERRGWSRAALAASLAASFLGGLWFAGEDAERNSSVVVAESTAPAATLDFQQIGSRVAQPEWWGSVVRAAWEPVDPLAEGFRPLTNSLQTAFELLTPRAGASTSVPLPLPEDANVGIAATPPRLV